MSFKKLKQASVLEPPQPFLKRGSQTKSLKSPFYGRSAKLSFRPKLKPKGRAGDLGGI